MSDTPKHTPLHAAHVEAGAKMAPFAGFAMPVQYKPGILAEHRAVREQLGVFDVSHMGEVDFRGAGAVEAVQGLVTNDIAKLADNTALYTVACLPSGGIVDDCIVYRFGAEHLRIVVNASNIAKDHAFFVEHAGGRCEIQNLSDEIALIAVQGPSAVATAARLCGPSLADVPPFGLGSGQCAGVPVTAARTGYTGEDGFELFVPNDGARTVWDALVDAGAQPAGLGARDTLRLEARLCLYGNDIDETTSPYEAGLGWVVKLDKGGDFVGREALVAEKAAGPKRRLLGFRVQGRGIARHDAEVVDADGNAVGKVTSGSVGPTVGGAIGLAYVPRGFAKPGQSITIRQRGKDLTAEIFKGPFYRRNEG